MERSDSSKAAREAEQRLWKPPAFHVTLSSDVSFSKHSLGFLFFLKKNSENYRKYHVASNMFQKKVVLWHGSRLHSRSFLVSAMVDPLRTFLHS